MGVQLLADVNLSDITFPQSSSDVVLTFLNMSDGDDAGSLICGELLAFIYHNYAGNALPQYVGEVNYTLVTGDEARGLIERYGYVFGADQNEPLGELHHVRIEGGPSIGIVCRRVKLTT